MSIAAVPPFQSFALATPKPNEEASESASARAQEVTGAQPRQSANVPGVGTVVDVSA